MFTLLGAVVLLLILVVMFWLGPTVKVITHKIGPKLLGSPIRLKHLSINPRKGTLHLDGLSISNLDGFGRSNVVWLAHLDVAIDMGSLFSETVTVHRVQIDSPHFTYEQNTASDNITEFILNIQDFIGIDPNAPKKEKKEKKEKTPRDPKKVIIESLEINDIQMHLANLDDPLLDIDLGVEQFGVSMTNGAVSLRNLSVRNPARLKTPHLFTLESVDVILDPATLYSDRISILDVQVSTPYAYLEQNPETDTVAEFIKIADRLALRTASHPPVTPPAENLPPPEPAGTAPVGVDLHNLQVNDIQLKLLDSTRTNAPAAPETLASIRTITVKLVEGTVGIDHIAIPNPPGFHAADLFHLDRIAITLDPESVFSDQVLIRQVLVESPKIHLEQTETTGNGTELQKTLAGFVPPAPETPDSPPITVAKPESAPPPVPLAKQPVLLETLLVTNLAVNAILPPPETSTSNSPAASAWSRIELSALNPTTYAHANPSNETASATTKEIPILAFDLLSVEPLKGIVVISNLRIGNPQGFSNPHLVMLQQFTLSLDPDSMMSDTLLIREIKIEEPSVAYERKLTTDNIKALQQTIEGAVLRREETLEKSGDTRDTASSTKQKVIIEHLLVENGTVRAKISALPTAPIPLPTIEMKDVGKKEGGASIGEASSQIFNAFYNAIIGVVANATGIAGDALKGAGGLTMDAIGSLTGGFSELTRRNGQDNAAEVTEEPEPVPEKKKRRFFKRRIFPR